MSAKTADLLKGSPALQLMLTFTPANASLALAAAWAFELLLLSGQEPELADVCRRFKTTTEAVTTARSALGLVRLPTGEGSALERWKALYNELRHEAGRELKKGVARP